MLLHCHYSSTHASSLSLHFQIILQLFYTNTKFQCKCVIKYTFVNLQKKIRLKQHCTRISRSVSKSRLFPLRKWRFNFASKRVSKFPNQRYVDLTWNFLAPEWSGIQSFCKSRSYRVRLIRKIQPF